MGVLEEFLKIVVRLIAGCILVPVFIVIGIVLGFVGGLCWMLTGDPYNVKINYPDWS